MTVIPFSSWIARSCSQSDPLCSVGQGQLFDERALKNTEYSLWRDGTFLLAAVIPAMFGIEVLGEV